MSFKPIYTITDTIANHLTAIERARGFLQAATISSAWVKAMARKAFLLESYHTTHIEGTRLTLHQAENLLAGKAVPEADPDDACELLNYKSAFEFVAEYISETGVMTEALIREIHKKLVQNVRGGSAAPGEYRKLQNYVANGITGAIVYMPPPPQDVPPMMEELVRWLNETKSINPVLLSAIAQFQLVHIHPFLDGNGRTSRLLSTLCLYRAGYDFKQLFTISEFYDKGRVEFYQALQQVRENNLDMTCWLEYFVTGLSTQMREVVRLGEQAIRIDVIAQEQSLNKRQIKVLQFLHDHESMTIQQAEKICKGVTRKTLQRDIKEILDKGIIRTSGKTSRLMYLLK